jgi:hypothetical protein
MVSQSLERRVGGLVASGEPACEEG